MSDRIGVLGEKAVASVGVSTAYTCPAGKAAKVKLQFRGIAGAASTLEVLVSGLSTFKTAGLTAGNVSHTTTLLMHNTQAAAGIDGSADAKVVAAGPKEYYISAGGTVQYDIEGAAFTSFLFQVVGTEIDVG